MKKKQIPLFKVFMSEDVLEPVNRTLMSGWIGQGQQVKAFEKLLGNYLGSYENVAAVNSATSGLTLALRLTALHNVHQQYDVLPDEILTTPLTCLATNMPIVHNGYKIKWVDVDRHTLLMDIADLRRKMSARTAAILVTHWGGMPHDFISIYNAACECHLEFGNRPLIIEDCAHALGSKFKDKMIGSHGSNICVFSFGPIKHLSTGDGGLMTFRDRELCDQAKKLRWYGLDRDSSDPHYLQEVQEVGFKFNMNDIAATIGIHNFPYIHSNIAKHQENARFYDETLRPISDIYSLASVEDATSSYWLYTVLVRSRDAFIKHLASHGIEASPVHSRNDTHPCFDSFKSVLPILNAIEGQICCIPVGWWVTPQDREHIVDVIKKGW